jgi:hypothetical protein
MRGVDEALVKPPVNAARLTLHPRGLAPRIENLAQWRSHLLSRIARDLELSADPTLAKLLAELRSYDAHENKEELDAHHAAVVIPLRLRTDAGVLSLFSTTTVFGTAIEVTVSELMLETFYPADERTAQMLRELEM